MLFWVSVPVLSVQMVLTPPIVSQADSQRTKFYSWYILEDEKAKVNVTAKGNPVLILNTFRNSNH